VDRDRGPRFGDLDRPNSLLARHRGDRQRRLTLVDIENRITVVALPIK
jgi:hypothetical protein